MVAKYLREQGFAAADRRLREGRADDQGDIDGVPLTTIQVKFEKANRYQAWITATLRQREAAGNPLCLLVRRVLYKPVEQWDAYMPTLGYPEAEAWTWTRMDLRLGVDVLKRKIATEELSRSYSALSLATTTSMFEGETRA